MACACKGGSNGGKISSTKQVIKKTGVPRSGNSKSTGVRKRIIYKRPI